MPEASPTPWVLELVLSMGIFASVTWGFLILFKPRTYRPDPPSVESPVDEDVPEEPPSRGE